jgi:hypothetical protein
MVVSQLERWGLPRAEAESLARDYPTRSRQQLIVVDWLDRRGHPDLGKSPADTLRQAIQGNRKPPSAFGPLPFVHVEYAILFRDGSAGAASFERDLSQYQLAGLPELAFKIQSEVPLRIRITLISASGSARAEIEVLKSSRRKRCTVPIRQFQTVAGQFSMDGLKSVRFEELREVPESAGRAWFDNLEFRRPAQVSRFEAVKLVHCAVPTAAGLVVFVLLLWGLRLEEAGDVVRWLREHGWERIRRRLKR